MCMKKELRLRTWGCGEGIEEVSFHRDPSCVIVYAISLNARIQFSASASLTRGKTQLHCSPKPNVNECRKTLTCMKKSLGFPTSDLHRSPRKREVRCFSSIEPSVPKNTPSSPWLNRTQMNEATLL